MGSALDQLSFRIEWGHWNSLHIAADLLSSSLVIPVAFRSFFVGYGLVIYPLCLLAAWAFIRMELSFYWLLIPVVLVALDRATIPGSYLW